MYATAGGQERSITAQGVRASLSHSGGSDRLGLVASTLVISRDGREIVRRTLARSYPPDANALSIENLDGTGPPEVIVRTYAGGNGATGGTNHFYIYSGTRGLHRTHCNGCGFEARDIDGDGRSELISHDVRVAGEFFEASPSFGFPVQVFAFRPGSLREVSKQFPSELSRDAEEHLAEAQRRGDQGDDALPQLAAYLADFVRLGRLDEGLAVIAGELEDGLGRAKPLTPEPMIGNVLARLRQGLIAATYLPRYVMAADAGGLTRLGPLTRGSEGRLLSLADAIGAFGTPRIVANASAVGASECVRRWPSLGLTVLARRSTPPSTEACSDPTLAELTGATISAAGADIWRTDRGLRVGDPASAVARRYSDVRRESATIQLIAVGAAASDGAPVIAVKTSAGRVSSVTYDGLRSPLPPRRSKVGDGDGGRGTITIDGVGPLRIGESSERQVRDFAGNPSRVETVRQSGVPRSLYRRLYYRCRTRECETIYGLATTPDGGRLSSVSTSSRSFRTAAGTQIGMTVGEAERRERLRASSGCGPGPPVALLQGELRQTNTLILYLANSRVHSFELNSPLDSPFDLC